MSNTTSTTDTSSLSSTTTSAPTSSDQTGTDTTTSQITTPPPPPTSASSTESSTTTTTTPSSNTSNGSQTQTSGSTQSDTNTSGGGSTTNSQTQSQSETTLSTPVTTVVQTTVVTTSNGQVFTTVFQTESTLPPGSVITSAPSSGNNTSSNHTGAIVGGVVGGVAGVAILVLLLVWGYKRWRRRRALDAFDGNFDPDRVVRPQSGAFGVKKNEPKGAPTLPNIAVGPDMGNNPQMAQYEDDGMGGRLNASAVGGGVVSPYPLFHQGGQHSPHPSQVGFPQPQASQHGHGSDGHTIPSSASASAYSPVAAGFAVGGHPGEWRHPSPGPSLGGSTSHSGGTGGGGMSPARLAKEREAFGGGFAGAGGMPVPHHGSPGAPPSAYNNVAQNGQRRMSVESGGAQSGVFHSTNSDYSQGTGTGTGTGTGQHQQRQPVRLSVSNPDEEGGGAGTGFDERARQAYLTSGPQGTGVRVAQDAGAVGDEEIPPTYESLLSSRGGRPATPPEKGGAGNRERDASPGASGQGVSGSGTV